MWNCPACGARNAMDAAECASCGRWASIFDLERVDDDGETYAPPPAAEAEVAEPTAAEMARTVLDSLRGRPPEGAPQTDAEPPPSRSGSMIKWIVIGAAVLWFLIAPLLERLT
jgi:hypothetical protein